MFKLFTNKILLLNVILSVLGVNVLSQSLRQRELNSSSNVLQTVGKQQRTKLTKFNAVEPCASVDASTFVCPLDLEFNVGALFADPNNPCASYYFQCEPNFAARCRNCGLSGSKTFLFFHQTGTPELPSGYCDYEYNVPACTATTPELITSTTTEPKTTPQPTITQVSSTSTEELATSTTEENTTLGHLSTTHQAAPRGCAMPNPPCAFGGLPVMQLVTHSQQYFLPRGWWMTLPNVPTDYDCQSICCVNPNCITAIYKPNFRECHIVSTQSVIDDGCSSPTTNDILYCRGSRTGCPSYQKIGFCNVEHNAIFTTLNSSFLCTNELPC